MDYSKVFSGVQAEALDGISTAAPVAAIIFGTVLAIGIGIKVFSKLAKKG